VHGLDIVEGKINNDDVSVLRDTGGTSSILCGTDVFT
jgi:predicted aspartyl protease